MTARFGAAFWPVCDRQIPWEGMDQLAHVLLFCPRWTVQCPPCDPNSCLRRFPVIPYYFFLVPY